MKEGKKKIVKNHWAVACGIAVGAMTALGLVGQAQAIPAFARAYNTECTTCHTIVPERNKFGEAFKKNGFIWPGKRQAPKQQAQQKNDANKDALFISGIPAQFPVSFLGEVEGSYNRANSPKLDLFSTSGLEVVSAGAFRDVASWWGGFGISKVGDAAAETDTGELYIQFLKPFNLPVFVKVGRFNPTLSLWKENDHTSVETFAFITNKISSAGPSSLSDSDATAFESAVTDRLFSLDSKKNGIELSKVFGSKVYATAGVLNSEGGNNNDFYGHLSVRLLGTDFLGKQPQVSLTSAESIFDYLTVTIGGYGYSGSWQSPDTVVAAPVYGNDFYRAGLESEILYKALTVRLGASLGSDDNLYDDNQSRDSHSYLGQAEYMINSKVVVGARYEELSAEQNDGSDAVNRIYGPSVTYAMLQNLKLSAEYTHDDGPIGSTDETVANIFLAF